MTRKQQILSSLTKASLNAIAREHEVKGAFHMYTEDLVRVLSRMRSERLPSHEADSANEIEAIVFGRERK